MSRTKAFLSFLSGLSLVLSAIGLSLAVTAPAQANVNLNFASMVSYGLPDTAYMQDIASADLNGDGKPELISANDGSFNMSVFVNQGDGTFTNRQDFSVNGTCTDNRAHMIATGDFNADGKIDLAFGSWGPNCVAVFLNNTPNNSATISFTNSNVPTIYGVVHAFSGPRSIAASDMDGDGDIDLVLTAANESTTQAKFGVLVNNGAGTFTFSHHDHNRYNNTFIGYPYGLALADMNSDGKPDVIAASASESTRTVGIQLWSSSDTQSGASLTGTYSAIHTVNLGFATRRVTVGDVNKDGKPDLVVPSWGSSVRLLINSTPAGATSVTLEAPQTIEAGSGVRNAKIADVNGDGNADIVAADHSGRSVSVITGNGDGTFNAGVSFNAVGGAEGLAIADFNGDNKIDIAVANQSVSRLGVLLNAPIVATPTPTPTPTPTDSPEPVASETPTQDVVAQSAPVVVAKAPQYPVDSLGMPNKVRSKKKVVLSKDKLLTNAGQMAKVSVKCIPVGKRMAPSGDVRYCKITKSKSGQISVRVVARSPFLLQIRTFAPETDAYLKYSSTMRIRMNS